MQLFTARRSSHPRLTALLLPICFAAGLLLARRQARSIRRSLHSSEQRYRKVVQTQSELAQALRQAQQALEQRQRELTHLARVGALGEITGALAHQLNQPITSILSNAQAALRVLTRERVNLPEVHDMLSEVVDQDQHAGELIRRLRELLKSGSPSFQPIDLNDVVSDIVELARGDLSANAITLRHDLATALPAVRADAVQLQQVVLNLLLNARDAMSAIDPAQRELDIRTALDPTGMIELSVRDRGCGIPAVSLERVFESFYTTKPHGLGLGLTIGRTIVAAHGGRLWASSNEGAGVTFHLTLHPATSDSARGPQSIPLDQSPISGQIYPYDRSMRDCV